MRLFRLSILCLLTALMASMGIGCGDDNNDTEPKDSETEMNSDGDSDSDGDTDTDTDSDTDTDADPDGGPEDTETGDPAEVCTSGYDVTNCGTVAEGVEYFAEFADGLLQAECAVSNEELGFPCIGAYSFHDGTSEMVPLPNPVGVEPAEYIPTENCGGDDFALCMSATEPFTSWGAGVAIEWGNNPEGETVMDKVVTRDLTAFKGLGFWAVKRGGQAISFTAEFADPNNDPKFGICNAEDSTVTTECYSTFRKNIVLTGECAWEYQEVLFDELTQPGWGYQAEEERFLKEKSIAFKFQVAKGATFDFCIDNLHLIPADPEE